jgi:hypothetical protein
MDELLSERWEWHYENRLKHPSEAQEENIRKLDFLLVIKKKWNNVYHRDCYQRTSTS